MAHDSLNLLDAGERVLPNASDPAEAAGAVAQGYDPRNRWTRFENAFRDDFRPLSEAYTSDSAAAGTTMQTGRKTANGPLDMDWTGPSRTGAGRRACGPTRLDRIHEPLRETTPEDVPPRSPELAGEAARQP